MNRSHICDCGPVLPEQRILLPVLPPSIWGQQAGEMMQALGQRRISAVALLELHLRRIKQYDPTLNAIVPG